MLIMFNDKQHLVAYQQSVKPDDITYCVWRCLLALRSMLSESAGHFHFLPFSATFCRFKLVETNKWQKTLFAGKNANPDVKQQWTYMLANALMSEHARFWHSYSHNAFETYEMSL